MELRGLLNVQRTKTICDRAANAPPPGFQKLTSSGSCADKKSNQSLSVTPTKRCMQSTWPCFNTERSYHGQYGNAKNILLIQKTDRIGNRTMTAGLTPNPSNSTGKSCYRSCIPCMTHLHTHLPADYCVLDAIVLICHANPGYT